MRHGGCGANKGVMNINRGIWARKAGFTVDLLQSKDLLKINGFPRRAAAAEFWTRFGAAPGRRRREALGAGGAQPSPKQGSRRA